MACFAVYFYRYPMFKRALTAAFSGSIISGIIVADVRQGIAQLTFDPNASQTTYFALDEGCVGRIPPNFAYFCTRMDYNTGPFSSNFHFTGQGGTVITYIVEPTSVRPNGPSSLQAIILREKIDGKSATLTDFSGSCEVREQQDVNYFLVRCSAQKGEIIIENMGRFYK
jgi:hypothetical protein